MAIDTGARSHGRAASRIGPTHTNTRAPVTRAARSYQRTVGDSSQRVNLGNPRLTTAQRIASVPPKRKASLQAALHRVLKSYGSRSVSGFTPEQNATLRTVLGVGTSMGATPKEKLSAVETGLVESSFTNPNEDNSDGTSAGWRQETQQARYGSEARRMNPKPTAKDYFSETRSAGRGAGMTAGQLSQRVQGSAYPGRYDAVQGKAKQVLKAASAPPPNPKDVHKLAKAGIKPPHASAPSATKASPQIRHQEQLVNAGKYNQGSGSLVLNSGVDIKSGQEPQIAARLKLLSAKIGKPIYIISGHRTPQHSVAVGGFADDPHTQAKAADIGVGSAMRDSAGQLTSAQLASVGLVRPFGGASEINHVELANGSMAGAPISGGGAGGTSGVAAYASSTGQTRSQATRTLSKMTPRQRATALRTALNRTLRGYGGLDSASHSSSSSTPLTHVSGKPVV